MKNGRKISLSETAVIYFSDEDGCWIAHGLRTDQIGIGERVVAALADLVKAIDQICRLAEKDETIAYKREAPRRVQRLLKTAKKLPKEVYEVAHKMARGQWPDYLEADFPPKDEEISFVAKVSPEAR